MCISTIPDDANTWLKSRKQKRWLTGYERTGFFEVSFEHRNSKALSSNCSRRERQCGNEKLPVGDTVCHCLLQMLIDATNDVVYSIPTDLLFKAPDTLPFVSEDGENFGDNSDMLISGQPSR